MCATTSVKMTRGEREWLGGERNTGDLLRAVYADRIRGKRLSGGLLADALYALCRLTWITKGYESDVNEEHWRNTKVPALGLLYHVPHPPINADTLEDALDTMPLPESIVAAACKWTGIVNLYGAFRNSLRPWIGRNAVKVAAIFSRAYSLSSHRQARQLADTIDRLPRIPLPSSRGRRLPAANVLTPVVACLDPRRRFPLMNSRNEVLRLLRGLGVGNETLGEQHDAMVGLIGQGGIEDAFMVDVLGPKLLKRARSKVKRKRGKRKPKRTPAKGGTRRPLSLKDESEVEAVRKSLTVTNRHVHDKMTNALKEICGRCQLDVEENTSFDSRWDALVHEYAAGRDLLIEAKSIADRACVRLAVGQLLDYRRSVPRQWATSLAVLLPQQPKSSSGISEYLADVGVKLIWFSKGYRRICGEWEVG